MSAIVFIPLTQGKVAVIDFEDFEKVRPYKWYARQKKGRWYAGRNLSVGTKQTTQYLHRFLLEAPVGKQVDHKDGDGLYNRRHNIRVCTKPQNQYAYQNKRIRKSKFRGVTWEKAESIWRAQIGIKGKKIHIGRFVNQEEAALAYDKKARELFGEWASPNFPV